MTEDEYRDLQAFATLNRMGLSETMRFALAEAIDDADDDELGPIVLLIGGLVIRGSEPPVQPRIYRRM